MMEPMSPIHPSVFGAGGAMAGDSLLARDSSVHRQNTDGVSMMSGSDGGPFSTQDAAILAQAFRSQLRKPEFEGRPDEEGESPDEVNLINAELAAEGTTLHNAGSARHVRVEDSLSGDHAG